MKKRFVLIMLLLISCLSHYAYADVPDTVKAGIYITSIHDIDFKQREYNLTAWLWLRYKNKNFKFDQNLEIPQSKSVTKSFSTTDTSNGEVYMLMKLDCVMKDSWKITNFPFDKQKLRFSIENSQFDSAALVFVADTLGKHFDPKYTLRGWNIDSINIKTGSRAYETTFGDKSLTKPHAVYANYKVTLVISRDAMGLFWKIFLGMYVAFLIAFMCFYLHVGSLDSRFSLSVGALFAVVGNKYIVDASLPESGTFTLVDALHGTTLLFILGVIICNSIVLYYVRRDNEPAARRFDRIVAPLFLALYILINVYLIYSAVHGS